MEEMLGRNNNNYISQNESDTVASGSLDILEGHAVDL